MPRLMSFAETVDQIREQTKTVTRRDSEWWAEVLEPGTLLMAVSKSPFADPDYEELTTIEVVDVRREPIGALDPDQQLGLSGHRPPLADTHYTPDGRQAEVIAEGFSGMTPREFVEFFCEAMDCQPDDEITRIEFRYLDNEEQL